MAAATSTRRFDDRNIQWQALGDFEHLEVTLLGVDEENNIVDLMVKFAPNEKIFLHRHLALTNTLVVDGEHIIYEADGSAVKDVRPVGKYTSSPAGDAHLEGGGADGAVVHYSVRGDSDALFDVLNDDMSVAAILRTSDFKAVLDEQKSVA